MSGWDQKGDIEWMNNRLDNHKPRIKETNMNINLNTLANCVTAVCAIILTVKVV